MKNEKGFTLVEMVVSIGVIAIIGTLLISTIISTNANTETADLLVFMERLSKESGEICEANPTKIISGSIDASDMSLYPYNSMTSWRYMPLIVFLIGVVFSAMFVRRYPL